MFQDDPIFIATLLIAQDKPFQCSGSLIPVLLLTEKGECSGEAESMELGVHYHIRWSSDSSLDSKPFRTKHEATKVAEGIKKKNEGYIIAKRDDECERCKEFKLKAFFAVNE